MPDVAPLFSSLCLSHGPPSPLAKELVSGPDIEESLWLILPFQSEQLFGATLEDIKNLAGEKSTFLLQSRLIQAPWTRDSRLLQVAQSAPGHRTY